MKKITKEQTLHGFEGFNAVSNEELEKVDGGGSLNEKLGIEKIVADTYNGVSVGTGGLTIHSRNVSVNVTGQLYPPEAKVTITVAL